MMRTRYIAVAVGALVVGSLLVSDARAQRDFVYEARQVSALKIDGVFNEWFDAQVIVFDQLKDRIINFRPDQRVYSRGKSD